MSPFYSHVFFMTAGLLAITAGVGIARFLRQKRWWLKIHRPAGIIGAACLVAGLVSAVIMVSQSGDGQFKVPHAWLGLTTVLCAIAAPALGHLQFKIRSIMPQLRRWHRRIGYASLVLTVFSAFSGLVAAGIV
jgi:cellobiose-specific phosphotransferase system component IIC